MLELELREKTRGASRAELEKEHEKFYVDNKFPTYVVHKISEVKAAAVARKTLQYTGFFSLANKCIFAKNNEMF